MKKGIILTFCFTLLITSFFMTDQSVSYAYGEIVPNNYMDENTFYQDFDPYIGNIPSATGFNSITYFKNLYNYSAKNIYGSCGYVSFIQYLSYYDTFLNDDIIPEIYEGNQGTVDNFENALSISPGILRNEYSYFTNLNYNSAAFKTYVENYKDVDFQMLLMYVKNEANNWTSNAYYSIGMWSYQTLLNYLFPNNDVDFNYTRVNNFGANAKPTDQNVIDYFDSYIKGQLDLGNPVMLHIAKYNEETNEYDDYHSVVAYYYDDNGIHAHFGWGITSTDVIINQNYQITEAGVVDFTNINHKHSNNYVISNIGYCGCGHFHTYINYQSIDSSTHYAYCECSEMQVESHDYMYIYLNNSRHKTICSKCGYNGGNNAHVYKSNDLNYCIACKRVIQNPGYGEVIVPWSVATEITANGSYILPNGCIVLVPEDVEAYFNGTLVFYNQNQVPETA